MGPRGRRQRRRGSIKSGTASALDGSSDVERKSDNALAGVASGGVQKPARPLSALQRKLALRLAGGDFRQLNERMYTSTGAEASALMRRQPGLFAAYHRGYADQVRRWPSNPLDHVLAFLKTQPTFVVVADMGCGEARLAQDAPQTVVHSFDLVAVNDRVVACDIARTPLKDGVVDVVVFCLALMGTNYGDFLQEARRIVKRGGWMLIAEVASRFDERIFSAFKRGVESLGFNSCEKHGFVSSASFDVSAKHCSRGRAQKEGSKVPRRGKRGSRYVDDRKGSTMSDAPFFLRFAFQAVEPGNSLMSTKFPPLKACVYKRR